MIPSQTISIIIAALAGIAAGIPAGILIRRKSPQIRRGPVLIVFYGSSENRRLVAMGYGMLFNHSSQPNVAYYREDTRLGAELVLYALRNIRKGEELYYNYGDDWWTTRK